MQNQSKTFCFNLFGVRCFVYWPTYWVFQRGVVLTVSEVRPVNWDQLRISGTFDQLLNCIYKSDISVAVLLEWNAGTTGFKHMIMWEKELRLPNATTQLSFPSTLLWFLYTSRAIPSHFYEAWCRLTSVWTISILWVLRRFTHWKTSTFPSEAACWARMSIAMKVPVRPIPALNRTYVHPHTIWLGYHRIIC